ncbi:hypothetical protein PGB90_009112 [Kerria lacca]
MTFLFCSRLNPFHERSRIKSETLSYFAMINPVDRLRNGVSVVYLDVAERRKYPTFTLNTIKNEKKATKYKKKARKLHAKGRNNKAMKYIILSVNVCPDTYHLDVAMGHRSLLLFVFGDYVSALVDTNRVLINNRSSENFLSLISETKADCISQLNKKLKEHEASKQKQYSTIIDPDVYNNVTYRLKLFKKKLEYKIDDTEVDFRKRIRIPTIYYKNNLLPSASAKIKISTNQIKKRLIVAAEEVQTGEILIVEKPLVSALNPYHILTHCSHCFVRCTSLIPCKECYDTMYCSQRCYDEAISRYHRVECRVFQFTETHKLHIVGSKLMALRLFLFATRDGTLLRNLMNDEVYGNISSNKDFNFDSIYIPEDYFNIHNLEDCFEHLSAEEYYKYSKAASFILLCLKKISFFNEFQDEEDQETLTELEEFAGKLLLKFILCVHINGHEVSEFIQFAKSDRDMLLGVAIYPTLRFASHSCNHNIVRHFHRNCVVVRAFRPIISGEEIFDNYGTSYLYDTLEVRRSYLKENYFFECQCIACEQNWPLLENLPSKFSQVRCLIPREQLDTDRVRKLSQMYRKTSFGYSDRALAIYYTYLTFLHKTFQQPFKEHTLVELSITFTLSSRETVNYFSTINPIYRLRQGVRFVYPDVAEYCKYPIFTSNTIKDNGKSKKYKKRAIKLYAKGKNDKAMKYIILSVNVCPDTYHLDVSMGGRSLILFVIGDYISALADINRVSFNKRSPENLLLRLKTLKADCIFQLNKKLQELEGFRLKQQRWIVDQDEYNNVMCSLKIIRRKSECDIDDPESDLNNKIRVPTIYNKNELLPNASAKIKICKNEIKKRVIVAVEELRPGEILIVEKPLVFALDPYHILTHCSHCFVRCSSLIPCKGCYATMYCTERCYNEAIIQYHRVECRVFQFTETYKLHIVGPKLLTLRLFLLATKDGTLLKNLMNDYVYGHINSNKDFNFGNVYIPEDYFNIHNLEDCFENISPEEYYKYSKAASFLLLCLKKTSFFNEFQNRGDQETLTELEEFAGKLLLKFMLCVNINNHRVSEFVQLENDGNEKLLGIAIYPTLRFANHSCNHNIIKHFHKNCVVVRALRPIMSGEEVFDNYGTSYLYVTLEERRSYLKENYFFECQCIACEENWPLLKNLPSNFSEAVYLVPREQITDAQVKEWSDKYKKITTAYSDQALSFYYMYLIFLHKTFQPPFKEHTLVELSMTLTLSSRDPIYRLRYGVSFLYFDVAERHKYRTFTFDTIKNERKSTKYKKKARKFYANGNNNKAMKYIILSVNVCPDTYYLDVAMGTLADANRILINNRGPESFLSQISEAKAECISVLNKKLQEHEILRQKQYSVITDPDVFNNVMYRLLLIQRKLEFNDDDTEVDFNNRIRIPTLSYINDMLPNASAKIKIGMNQISKRIILATEEIQTGEILIIEKPLVFALDPYHILTHCSHCFVRCTSLIPCKECYATMYCGQTCYDEAISRYHRVECRVFQFTETHKLHIVGSKLMALRLFLFATRDGTLLRNLMNDEVYRNVNSNKDFKFDSVYIPEDYFNIHNLEDCFEHLSAEEYYKYSKAASFILLCLKKISFFNEFQDEEDQETLTELEEFAGKLLLKFILCVHINGHGVYEFIEYAKTSNVVPVGVAIYPTLRFASHSCNHNIVRHYYRNCVVVRAFRPIMPDEEIFDNYGTSYLQVKLEERRSYLKKNYYFECQCIACVQNWPLMKNLPSRISQVVCLIPMEQLNIDQVKEWSERFKKISSSCSDQALAFFYTYLTFLHKTFQQPFKEYASVGLSILMALSYRKKHYMELHTINSLSSGLFVLVIPRSRDFYCPF